MKILFTIFIIMAFVLLPLAVGWSAYEIGKGVGKTVVVETEKECPVSGLDFYCEEQEEIPLVVLSKMMANGEFTINCE